MTAEEAIRIARRVAGERRWTWLGPGIARKGGWLLRIVYARGRPVWEVHSHDGRGCLVRVVIEDATSRTLRAHFMPR
jgi:hypothetical protein